MKLHFEVVEPVVHHLIFQVFFAEGFAYAVNKVAARRGFYVDEFREVMEIQVHHQRAREAKLILDSLKRDKAVVQEKLKRAETLKAEVWRIRREVARGNAYAIISEGLTAKKQELAQLEAEFLNLINSIKVYECLIAKFEALAFREKRRGRHRHPASSTGLWLSIMEP